MMLDRCRVVPGSYELAHSLTHLPFSVEPAKQEAYSFNEAIVASILLYDFIFEINLVLSILKKIEEIFSCQKN